MGLQNVCDSLVEETDGLLACIVLDLDTGLTLATSCREGIDAAAASTVTRRLGGLFRSKSLTLTTPKRAEGLVREAQVTSRNTYHFMATLPGWNSALLVFVTEKVVSIGLGWMAVHQAFDRVLQARPGAATTELAPEPQTPAAAAPEPPTPPPAAAERRTPPPAAPSDRPLQPPARPEPRRGVGPAATSPAAQGPPRQTMPPAAQTPRRQATPPVAPQRQAMPPLTQPAPRPDSDGPAGGSPPPEETESAPAAGNVEPPMLNEPDSRVPRPGRQTPAVRPRPPTPIPAAGKDPVQPPDGDEPKTDVGRMGARAVFGTKARRS